MAWQNVTTSKRKAELPPHWRQLRRLVLERDGNACTWTVGGQRCGAPANQVDHINDPNDHHPGNLRSLCEPHHARRTAAQGGRARAAAMSTKRPPERHAGLRLEE